MKKFVSVLIVSAFLAAATCALAAKSAKDVWNGVSAAWAKCEDVKGAIAFFTFYPESIRGYFPGLEKELEGNLEGWRYQVFEYTWKKPHMIHIKFVYARNIGDDMVGKMLENHPGTRLVFGAKDMTNIYAKFPLTGDASIDRTIEKQIYRVPYNSQQYSAAIMDGLNFAGTLEDILKSKKHYFDDGSIKMKEVSLCPRKGDFKVENGVTKYTEKNVQGNFYLLTLTPKDVKKNKGIEKELVYINKDNLFPEQFEEYHKGMIVASLVVDNVKVNQNLDDSLWKAFFKGARVIEGKGAAAGK